MSEARVVTSGWIPNEPPVSDELVSQLLRQRDLEQQMANAMRRLFGSVGGYIVKDFEHGHLDRNPLAYAELLVKWVADHKLMTERLDPLVSKLQQELRIKDAVIELLRKKLGAGAAEQPD